VGDGKRRRLERGIERRDRYSMSGIAGSKDILGQNNASQREKIVDLLTTAYWMEIETVMNYIQASVNLDGIRAEEIAESLRDDVQEELGHAQQFAQRIKDLYGTVPGSAEFSAEQRFLQPPDKSTNVVQVINGVMEAEKGAIEHYNRLIEATDGVDWVTQDLVIEILADEQNHYRTFESFLKEFEDK
jgi:bacterioferritin